MEPRSLSQRLDEISERRWVAVAIWATVVLAISLLHLCINARDIGNPELWLDESSTWGVAHRPFLTVLTLPTQFHSQPPLYYLVLHFVMKLYDARWFLRSIGWLSCLVLIQLVLFWLRELSLSARVVLCVAFITANLTHYLSTALRPYGMAALTTFVSTVLLLRLLREPTRRRALLYAGVALAMLYTMAFDAWVFAAHGITAAGFLIFHLTRHGLRAGLERQRPVVAALLAVVVGYLPYLWMAVHWHYARNAEENGAQILTSGHYTYIADEHFGFGRAAMAVLYALAALGLLAELRAKNALVLVWPLVAIGQVAFVVYFMTGRGLGPTGRYITPALPAVCFLVALGWHHLVPRPPRVAWQLMPLVLGVVLWPDFGAYAAYLKSPRPLGPLGKLRQHMKQQPGNKLIFFDVGYAGQDLEYVIRNDRDITTALMRGEGGNAGGDNHLDPDYIVKTIARTHAETRCYYYEVQNPNGVYATTFVPEMRRLGYAQVYESGATHGFCSLD